MWPHMETMGLWMTLWWVLGLAVLVLLVWIIARSAGGVAGPADETPELILKRRYARGELEREDYQRRLEDLRR